MNPLEIPAVTLVRGNHYDMAHTGKGCIMNLIAYMQGDSEGDRPENVCGALRGLAIFVNDRCADEDREPLLLPLVEPLMNTATNDHDELVRRFNLMANFLEAVSPERHIAARCRMNGVQLAYYHMAKEIATWGDQFDDRHAQYIVARKIANLLHALCNHQYNPTLRTSAPPEERIYEAVPIYEPVPIQQWLAIAGPAGPFAMPIVLAAPPMKKKKETAYV